MADFMELWLASKTGKREKAHRSWLGSTVKPAPELTAERIGRRKQLAAVSGRTYKPPE